MSENADHWWSRRIFTANFLLFSWITRRAQSLKRYLLQKVMNQAPENRDKIKFIDRMLDGVLLSLLLVKTLEYLSMETGWASWCYYVMVLTWFEPHFHDFCVPTITHSIALGSVFAVGTTGGLMISLASQGKHFSFHWSAHVFREYIFTNHLVLALTHYRLQWKLTKWKQKRLQKALSVASKWLGQTVFMKAITFILVMGKQDVQIATCIQCLKILSDSSQFIPFLCAPERRATLSKWVSFYQADFFTGQ